MLDARLVAVEQGALEVRCRREPGNDIKRLISMSLQYLNGISIPKSVRCPLLIVYHKKMSLR